MQQLLSRFSRGRKAAANCPDALGNTLAPDAPFYAVGDIHGRCDLLKDLLATIDPTVGRPIVFLGDYIDRGPESAATLLHLYELTQKHPAGVVCLMGNHEKMMLDFIDDPLGRGASWVRCGGDATLASYGIDDVSQRPNADALVAASNALEEKIPDDLLVWLRQRPLHWNSGNIWCVHAAMSPRRSPQTQKSQTMLWGHRDFLTVPRHDGFCVVHGHTTVNKPMNGDSRIAIDTGAYQTGRLTAAYIAQDHCAFIST